MPDQSQLIRDLDSVPNIVAKLGLSVAEAQKAFNVDYLNNVERLLYMAKSILDPKQKEGGALDADDLKRVSAFRDLFSNLLMACAPPRYQFTETTLNVHLDLAQKMQQQAGVGLGVGYGAVSINASFAIGYAYDYRAAAECKTVIHAHPPDQTVFQALLSRAKELNDRSLELPERTQWDQAVFESQHRIMERVAGIKLPAPKPE